MTTNNNIGRTILAQLGNGTLYMLGAKNIVLIEGGVKFKIGRNSKSVNLVTITLDPSDTYNVEFGRLAKKRGEFVPSYTKKSEALGVYVDSLHATIEEHTGLYTKI